MQVELAQPLQVATDGGVEKRNGRKNNEYTEFVAKWTPRFTLMAIQHGFRGQDLEDVVARLFADFYEGDYLRIFDSRKATFSTFAHTFAFKRLRGYRDKAGRMRAREISADKRSEETGELTLDRVVAYEEGGFVKFDISVALRDVVRQAQVVSDGSSRKLGVLLLLMVKQIQELGEVDKQALASFFGVSQASIRLWVQDIRYLPAMQALACDDYYARCSLPAVRGPVAAGSTPSWY